MPGPIEHPVPPLINGAAEFEIEIPKNGAAWQASNGRVAMSVYPDGEARMRKRNAIKNACTPKAHKVQWLFGELDGVRCYVADRDGLVSIVMTKQDLYP